MRHLPIQAFSSNLIKFSLKNKHTLTTAHKINTEQINWMGANFRAAEDSGILVNCVQFTLCNICLVVESLLLYSVSVSGFNIYFRDKLKACQEDHPIGKQNSDMGCSHHIKYTLLSNTNLVTGSSFKIFSMLQNIVKTSLKRLEANQLGFL